MRPQPGALLCGEQRVGLPDDCFCVDVNTTFIENVTKQVEKKTGSRKKDQAATLSSTHTHSLQVLEDLQLYSYIFSLLPGCSLGNLYKLN